MPRTPKMFDDDTRKRLTERLSDFSSYLDGSQLNALRLSWGIEDGLPKSNIEIAQRLRLTSAEVEQVLSAAESIIYVKERELESEWLEEHSGSLA